MYWILMLVLMEMPVMAFDVKTLDVRLHVQKRPILVGLEQWIQVIQNALPSPRGYAEHYCKTS